ncbi:MAG: hypothetical protein R3236_09390 [Phycisphaeraceae bacterium]|nr:hypothetical protein [Phycisphaeraceae bacterium]
MSPQLTDNLAAAAENKDGLEGKWHPARISDRKLLELVDQLERLRQLGGPFAKVGLSPPLQHRLAELKGDQPI